MHKMKNFENGREPGLKCTPDVPPINTDTGPFLGQNPKQFVKIFKNSEASTKYAWFNPIIDVSQ